MTKLRFALVFLLPAILAISPATHVSALTEEISLEEIIEKVKMRQSRVVRDLANAVYSAEALYK